MLRKRKLDAKSFGASSQRRRQEAEEEESPSPMVYEEVQEVEGVDEAHEVEGVDEVHEVEVEDEECEEEEEQEGEGDEEGGEEEEEVPENQNQEADADVPAVAASSEASDEADGDAVDENDGDEPIHILLEPFSKEQLVNLLQEAAEKHADIAGLVRKIADEDPAHRKIFVHGLGWDTNTETLISVFKQYGEIEDCKAVCDKISGKSKGYGFILFKSRKGACKALLQPQKKIGSRMTACQLATVGPVLAGAPTPAAAPHAAMPSHQVQVQVQQQSFVSEYTQRKIYVSNVSADLDPQKLLYFFSKFGEIEEGPLGLDKHTGKPKGFCLFVYRSVDSARNALEEPHKNFDGHILHCQKAIDGPKPGKAQQSHYNTPRNGPFQRSKTPSYSGPNAAPPHLMAPSAVGLGMNQAALAGLNPTVGQALSALLATQGAGSGLTNLLGTLGSAGMNQGVVPGTVHGMQSVYGNQGPATTLAPGLIGYGAQGAYSSHQMGQGGSGMPQHGGGHLGGLGPYMGH